jgi:hypothetical protein
MASVLVTKTQEVLDAAICREDYASFGATQRGNGRKEVPFS